jgi:rsbT co-antagonist protein RsbR
MTQGVFIASGEIQQLADLYTLGPDDLERIQSLGSVIEPKIEEHVGRFYNWLGQQPEYPQFFTSDELLARVKRDQAVYWQEFFSGRIDAAYVERRRGVGEVHARIGLPLPTYFAAMNLMLEIYSDATSTLPSVDRATAVSSLAKLIHFDTSLVVETFSQIISETIAEQSRSLIAMSTPVTAIWRDILLLPIVGVVDSRRAQEIMAAMLAKISDTQSKVIILDISGVAVVDTAVANHLIKITKATKLMGCECTISGVSPAIAQTVVELGIDVGEIHTTATLRDALGSAFDRVGASLADRG